jgi:hypothetical protein
MLEQDKLSKQWPREAHLRNGLTARSLTISDASTFVQILKQLHIQSPSYNDDWADGLGGYHIEQGRSPRPIGAVWLRLYWCRQEQGIRFDAIRTESPNVYSSQF